MPQISDGRYFNMWLGFDQFFLNIHYIFRREFVARSNRDLTRYQ